MSSTFHNFFVVNLLPPDFRISTKHSVRNEMVHKSKTPVLQKHRRQLDRLRNSSLEHIYLHRVGKLEWYRSTLFDFLGKLRANYLKREKNARYRTFQSVILAGVTDVKHVKPKIRPEDEYKENSPWNIAADFTIDMSLSENGIIPGWIRQQWRNCSVNIRKDIPFW